ncbi:MULTISPECIES: FG-GAP-like repeat-containing protein [Streptomyces]|uniref:Endonuclease n=1 Tax=Streptomyces tsukubensis (strain DSM 42081 / NBRC 108919 / NRRL 18488 / 9993) TaxID=1114943 RepID=I2N9R0_STRT9|nr:MULTISPECIES: FG-GAP-like repeat-containing protein [Streptomyces]AZK97581.1 endonuclease [Streptomyces tsukubensis]EIF93757.1 endonuclease/exonuclease/phosphatase [Streptomyces tsukubensis NRRL18488]MYS66132.1 endonuclease [Streptomyces sp. SID5473]QKM66475.1 endonuclease [Streptomyces tsukubensis NRRL18488]TAI45186.1 endonuclease [Streptomyces tsukubensis]
MHIRRAAVAGIFALAGLIAPLSFPAQADTVSPASAPVLRFLSYNICGNWEKCSSTPDEVAPRVQKVYDETVSWKSDVVLLQEVCRSQFNALEARLGTLGYSGSFTETQTPARDNSQDLCKDDTAANPVEGDYGLAVFTKGPAANPQVVDLATGLEGGTERWTTLCVDAPLQGITTRSCSVHLYSDSTTVAKQQAVKLATVANTWIDKGMPVVLGGDFNPRYSGGQADAPLSPVLDSFYSHSGGAGRFLEADETDASRFTAGCTALSPPSGHCRSGAPTLVAKAPDPAAKLDYIFLSKDHFKNVAGDVQALSSSVSDHHAYRGAATWSFCNNRDDGLADMLRRDASGDLWRHFGRPNGVLAPVPCKVGAGMSDLRLIGRGTDHNGGGEDLYSIDHAGDLHFHPGHTTELFFSTPRKVGWGWSAATALNSTPDMDGDGLADLLVAFDNGDLYLVPGNGDGTVDAKIRIGQGWGVYDTVLTPGDVTGDGKADVVARDTAGALFVFPGTGTGTLEARTQIGHGWQVYNTVFAPGDVNGDGKPDLLARDNAGTLQFYAGTGRLNGNATFAAMVKAGQDFSTTDLLR